MNTALVTCVSENMDRSLRIDSEDTLTDGMRAVVEAVLEDVDGASCDDCGAWIGVITGDGMRHSRFVPCYVSNTRAMCEDCGERA